PLYLPSFPTDALPISIFSCRVAFRATSSGSSFWHDVSPIHSVTTDMNITVRRTMASPFWIMKTLVFLELFFGDILQELRLAINRSDEHTSELQSLYDL